MNWGLSFWKTTAAAMFAVGMSSGGAIADTISPTSFSADLALGASVTIEKTVVISASGPTDATIDVMFVFDTTGSMGPALTTAKAAAVNILTGLTGVGDLHSGAGFYNDPGAGITSDLTANGATTVASINTYFPGGGGDYPELGFDGIGLAASGASWRPGSNRSR